MVSLYVRVVPERIALLRFLLEGYDGLALLSTMNRDSGVVRLVCDHRQYGDLLSLLADFSS